VAAQHAKMVQTLVGQSFFAPVLGRVRRSMDTTPVSLFDRLRQPGDASAWLRFSQICTPLLHRWARHLGLQDPDASDLVQEVFVLLLAKMPTGLYSYVPVVMTGVSKPPLATGFTESSSLLSSRSKVRRRGERRRALCRRVNGLSRRKAFTFGSSRATRTNFGVSRAPREAALRSPKRNHANGASEPTCDSKFFRDRPNKLALQVRAL
jgi:hypothetical protein